MKTFIDNQNGNTLASAMVEQLCEYRKYGRPVPELCIATAYFNPEGFLMLADELRQVGKVRLLLGAEPKPEALRRPREPGDPHEPEFTRREVSAALKNFELGLARDRDYLAFNPQATRALCETISLLKSPHIEVRRFEKGFLHAKAYLLREVPTRGLVAGSSNLTRAGLAYNRELNLAVFGNETAEKGEAWFDDLWEQSASFDLAAVYEALLSLFPPYLIYLKVLELLYGKELEEEEREESAIRLTEFQRHGVWRALKILEKYRGVIIADGVGLGKTFTAGEIIQLYRTKRQRVLLICPAALRDGTWREFINRFEIFIDCVSYEQLAKEERLGGDQRVLKSDPDDYGLVVIDEAHNYRNPDTPSRAAVLRRLLGGENPKDVVFLSATPVNNSLWDLYHLLRYYLKQDAQLADKGIISLRDLFKRASTEDAFSLSPDVLFPVVDATTVKRTRAFVRKYYQNDSIKDADGKLVPIVFPEPSAITLRYNLEKALPGIFQHLEAALQPADGSPPLLRLSRYNPEAYALGGDSETTESVNAFLGLVRSGILKRFESSSAAFVATLDRMVSEHDHFLDGLTRGVVLTTEVLRELAGVDDEEDLQKIYQDSLLVPVSQYQGERLRQDVTRDRNVLKGLAEQVRSLSEGTDPKFDALVEALVIIAKEALLEGYDEEARRQRRKVLIFSVFSETVGYLFERLKTAVGEHPDLICYRGRMASVSGTDSRDGVGREKAIEGFAPISTRSRGPDLFDLLVCTDVLAEGQNLQQARHIINYDLPWNPMRLVQRHGRIDRIGSPHPKVFMRTIFPDDRLDDLLNLEERIRLKLAHAGASVGVETAPIEGMSASDLSFTETRQEIEKLVKGDASLFIQGGTAGAAQTGEEYRQELRQASGYKDMLATLPWKAGSVKRAGENGEPGYFFCAKVADRIFLRFVKPDGAIDREIGSCLRRIECQEKEAEVDAQINYEAVYQAWDSVCEDIWASWMHETDPKNLQPEVRPLNLAVADFLRRTPAVDIPATEIERCLDVLESPWSRRDENLLREASKKEYGNTQEKISSLVKVIKATGIEPFQTPPPLPVIRRDEVRLVVWMALV